MKQSCKDIRVGCVVRSTAGRDRYRPFFVVAWDPAHPTAPAVIADGMLHTIEDKKHKNPAHLRVILPIGESDRKAVFEGLTNSEIAEICKKHDIRGKK